jgi:hypothetical protein
MMYKKSKLLSGNSLKKEAKVSDMRMKKAIMVSKKKSSYIK